MDRLALLAALLLALVAPARGAEIDSWTGRYEHGQDVAELLDEMIDARIREGVERANEAPGGCETGELYAAVKSSVSGLPVMVGHAIAEWLDATDSLDSRIVPFEESVFRDLRMLDGPSVHLRGLSGTILVDGHVIGVDKLGHFFAEGWGYFERAHLEARGLEHALEWGERSERGRFGWLTTGIYSPADLVANLNGMRFWMRFADATVDPLAEEALVEPYVRCVGDRWTVVRPFSLEDYVDGAWDEATNCPQLEDPEFAVSFVEHTAELETWWSPRRYVCPVRPHECELARERYGELAPRLLAPECLAAEESVLDTLRRWTGID